MKKLFSLIFSLMLSILIHAASVDSTNAVTMVSYEQRWLDSEGTLALRNNTTETIHNVEFVIVYLNMAGVPEDSEEFVRDVEIEPGMTKKLDIPGYESKRGYSYYTSEAKSSSPHRFKIKFRLESYNKMPETDEMVEEYSHPRCLSPLIIIVPIIVALFIWVLYIALFVIVAVLAKRYKRSVILWVLLSLFISPLIGVVVLLVIGKNNREDEDTP